MRLVPVATAIKSDPGAGAEVKNRGGGFSQSGLRLAVAGRRSDWSPLHRLPPTLRSSLVLLVRSHSAPRRGLVFRRELETALVARSPARLYRRAHFFLDSSFLANNRHRSRLVPASVLHGDLLRHLELVLRIVAPSHEGQKHYAAETRLAAPPA